MRGLRLSPARRHLVALLLCGVDSLTSSRKVHPRHSKTNTLAAEFELEPHPETIQNNNRNKQQLPITDAVAIVAGTAIGGGFLALPLVTQPMGFKPSLVALVAVWAFLTSTAILYAEAAAIMIAQKTATLDVAAGDGEDQQTAVSITSLSEQIFGRTGSIACSIAFACQMLSVVTAQVVKAGELVTLALPSEQGAYYIAGCVSASFLFGGFAFRAPSRVVETTNTLLTGALLIGFAGLFGSVVANAGGGAIGTAFQRLSSVADWSQLSPFAAGHKWAVPVFLNLLCFGQSIPFIVERMAPQPNAIASGQLSMIEARDEARRKTRLAIILGSLVPLTMCILWCAVTSSEILSTSLLDDDPVLDLIQGGPPSVSVPVAVIATGAIGTTLISSYLTIDQFMQDIFCTIFNGCSPLTARLATLFTILAPVALASGGPSLYLPLLAFAGAGPTTFLYGLIPPCSVFSLRSRAGDSRKHWLPFGNPPLFGLGFLSASIILLACLPYLYF